MVDTKGGENFIKRIGMALKLKPGSEQAYKKYHAHVWPEVLQTLKECNVRNYSILLKVNMLLGYLEYQGEDLKQDWAKMAADPKTQEWCAIMEPMQEPLKTRKEGEWWAEMEEVFHLD